ncbi:MAG: hypothetical protein ACOH2M_33215, partial [Cypionkella sp.]
IIDGLDEASPTGFDGVNFLHLRHRDWEVDVTNPKLRRAAMDRARARAMSDLARVLWRYNYGAVIATDVDEFLVADPARHASLSSFLDNLKPHTACLSGLGLDVVQHLPVEAAIDPSMGFLQQRHRAVISAAYTKPVLALQPVTWGAGLHRVKMRNYHIHPELFLLHFGLVDYETAMGRANDPKLVAAGWGPHAKRREALFRLVQNQPAVDGDSVFAQTRHRLKWRRRLLAWNKPAPLSHPVVITLPERFSSLV